MNSICDDRIGWHEVDPEPVQPRKECGWTEQERSVLNPDMAYDKIRLEWPNGLKYGFAEESAENMQYPLMAKKAKYLKDSPKGVAEMCKVIEEMRKQEREEGRAEGRAEGTLDTFAVTVMNMMKRLNLKLDEAIEIAAVPEKYVSAVKAKVLS